jgi:hypothetical protein
VTPAGGAYDRTNSLDRGAQVSSPRRAIGPALSEDLVDLFGSATFH